MHILRIISKGVFFIFPPPNFKDYDAIITYLNDSGNSIYCTFTSLCSDNISAFVLSDKFIRIEKVGDTFLIYMRIKRRH